MKPNLRGIAALEVLARSCAISRYSTSGRVNISVIMAAVALVAMPWPVAAGCSQYPMRHFRFGPAVGLAHANESAVFDDGVVVHVTACPVRLGLREEGSGALLGVTGGPRLPGAQVVQRLLDQLECRREVALAPPASQDEVSALDDLPRSLHDGHDCSQNGSLQRDGRRRPMTTTQPAVARFRRCKNAGLQDPRQDPGQEDGALPQPAGSTAAASLPLTRSSAR